MQIISDELLRQNLNKVIDQVVRDREILHVTRGGHESVVIISEADFEAIQTTLHLLSNQENVSRLDDSFKQAKAGEFVEVKWDE
ncbi:MAG: type II toxin-antitoxin system Phd/YefM family antitoxin [Proteobacteria bacterium]|nr:type II toxin-antitoxin system Phd/YefM family antitoxin [Pseudomonadota bacterium]